MTSETIGSFEKFLNYGPVGFAGLMLVLVIFAMTLQKPSAAHASLLKFFMVIGALCFLAALAAEFFKPVAPNSNHQMSVIVAPNDLGSSSSFPTPIIRLNGDVLDARNFNVSSRSTLLIDVTESVGAFKVAKKEALVKTRALDQATQVSQELRSNLNLLTTEVRKKDIALLKANELTESLILDISKIRQQGAIKPTLSPRTLQAIQNNKIELGVDGKR